VNSVANGQSPEQTETSLFSIVESVFRHFKLLVAVGSLTLLAGLALAFVPSKKYESEMELLVQNGRATETISAGATTTPAPSEVTDAQVNGEIDVMSSTNVLDEVVDPGWTSTPANEHSNDAVVEHEGKVGALRGRLTLTPGRKSRSFLVQYRATNPQEAYSVMTRLLSAFLNRQKDLGQPSQAPKFFTDEAARYKKAWEDAQAQLVQYQVDHQIVSVLDKESLTEKQLFELDSQLRAADVMVRETQGRIAAEEAEIKSQPRRVDTTELSSQLAATMDSLNTQLVTLTLKRTELLTKYVPTDRLVQEVDTELAQVNAALKDMKNGRTSSVTTNVNPTWLAADEELSVSRSLLRATVAQREQLAAEVADLKKQLDTVARDSAEYNLLDNKVTELQTNYVLFAKKRDEAIANSGMDQLRLLNVAVLENPTYSPDPVRPRPLLDTLLALFTAVFVAGFAVFVAEVTRSNFTSARDLDALKTREVLATVPWEPRG
jgi:uncharacterized protein involved in exopolysaccharide biosynthesis